jgi:hypothetical protein
MGYFSKEIPLNPDSSLGPVTIGSKITVERGKEPLPLEGGNVELVPGCGWDPGTVTISKEMNPEGTRLNILVSLAKEISPSHYTGVILKKKPIKLKVTLFPKMLIPGMGVPVSVSAAPVTDEVDVTIPGLKQPEIVLDAKCTGKTADGKYNLQVIATLDLPPYISKAEKESIIRNLTLEVKDKKNVTVEKGVITQDTTVKILELTALPDFKSKDGTAMITVASAASLAGIALNTTKQVSFEIGRKYILNIHPASLDITMKKPGSFTGKVLEEMPGGQKVLVTDARLSIEYDSDIVSVNPEKGEGTITCTVSQNKISAAKKISLLIHATAGNDSVKPRDVPVNLETIDYGNLEVVFLPALKNHLNPYIQSDHVVLRATLVPPPGNSPVRADIEFECETPGGWLDGPKDFAISPDPNSEITGPAGTTETLPFSGPVGATPSIEGDNRREVMFFGRVPDPDTNPEPPQSESVIAKALVEGTVVAVSPPVPIVLDPKPTLTADTEEVNFLANAKCERHGRPKAVISERIRLSVNNPGDEEWKISVDYDEAGKKLVSCEDEDQNHTSKVFLFEICDPVPLPEQKPGVAAWQQVVEVTTTATMGGLEIEGPTIRINILHEGLYPDSLFEYDKAGELLPATGKGKITINVYDPAEKRSPLENPDDVAERHIFPYVTFIVMEWDGQGLVRKENLFLDITEVQRSTDTSKAGNWWNAIFLVLEESFIEVIYSGGLDEDMQKSSTGKWHIIFQKQIPGFGERANGFVRFYHREYYNRGDPDTTLNWQYDLPVTLMLGNPDELKTRLSTYEEAARCDKIISKCFPEQHRDTLRKEIAALPGKGAEDYRRISIDLHDRAYRIWEEDNEDFLVWDARWGTWIYVAEKAEAAGDVAFNVLVMVYTAPLGFVASLGLSTVATEIKNESLAVYKYYVGQNRSPDLATCISDYVAMNWEKKFLELLSATTVELYLLKEFDLKKVLTQPKKYGAMIAWLWLWKFSVHIAEGVGTENQGIMCSAKLATQDIMNLALVVILADFVGAHRNAPLSKLFGEVRSKGLFGGTMTAPPEKKLKKAEIKAEQKAKREQRKLEKERAAKEAEAAKAAREAETAKATEAVRAAGAAKAKARGKNDKLTEEARNKARNEAEDAANRSKDKVNQLEKAAEERGMALGRDKVKTLEAAAKRLKEHPRDQNARKEFEKACEEVQKDKHAMNELNDIDPKKPNKMREAFNEHWKNTYKEVDTPVRERIAEELNKTLKPGEKPYTARDIEVVMPTNTPKGQTPREASVKSTYDRDVTYGNKRTGDDIPTGISRDIYNEEFFKNRHPDVKNPTKEQCAEFAKECDQTVTDRFSSDAYGGGKPGTDRDGRAIRKDLETATDKNLKGRPYTDVEAVANTMKTKVDEWYNEATPVQKPGAPEKAPPTPEKAAADKKEGMRQLTKQFDNQVEKVIDKYNEMAGYPDPPIAKISDKVRTGVEIMKKVGKDGFTVADAEAALGDIGETPKTIVDKMSANLESGQKFMSPEQKQKMNEWLATLLSE